MNSKLITLLAGSLLTAFLTLPTFEIQAQTKKATEKTSQTVEATPKTIDPNRKLPFYAKVAAVDKTAKTIKLGNRIFKVMPDTKMVNQLEKPATLDDAKIGEISGGSYKFNTNGTLELVMIRFGAKVDPKELAKAEAAAPKK